MIRSGDSIGPYSLLRSLGRGGFGEVWLAERASTLLTTQVALKLPLDSTIDLDIIREEAQIWQRASGHPNVVPVMEAEIYDGQVVIASEFIAGGSLADWLKQHNGKAPSVEVAVNMTLGILLGLEHLHQNGLIHRDLKPDNVLLQSQLPRLTDFGLSRVLKASGQTSTIAGTPAYMAPEAFQGAYSVSSDLWAAGTLLHELLVGTLPYPQADMFAIILAITREEPATISDRVPDSLRSVLEKALCKSPSGRYASAAEMAEALRAALVPGHQGKHGQQRSRIRARSVKPVRSSPSKATVKKRPTNLPRQLTGFVGREKQIEDVKELVTKTSLLTLTGTGGCGKTRLALQVASDELESYSDGCWFIELAPLAVPDLILRTIASAFALREEANRSLIQTVIEYFAAKHMLLILDNCEHVVVAAAGLAHSILKSCPGLRILATSREALRTQGEITYAVPPLTLPDLSAAGGPHHQPNPVSMLQSESVRLFVDHAKLRKPGFELTIDNALAVYQICRRLDGIPLALELAAAQVQALSLDQIAKALENKFRLTMAGSRSGLPHHSTLHAAFDWSYELLEESERTLFRRLAVFAGGCSLEGAAAVCSGNELDESDVLANMIHLVDQSLVVFEEARDRYRLLETARQYGLEKLKCANEDAITRTRHLDYFLQFAESVGPGALGPEREKCVAKLRIEADNLRSALEWSKTDGQFAMAGARVAGSLWSYWRITGGLAEGRSHLTSQLERTDACVEPGVRSRVLNGAGNLASDQGDYTAARAMQEEAVVLRRQCGDQRLLAQSLNNLGITAWHQGDRDAAQRLYQESLEIKQEIGDRLGAAQCLNNMGIIEEEEGRYEEASKLYYSSISIREEVNDRSGIASTLTNLGILAQRHGDFEVARSLYQRSLVIFQELGDQRCIAFALEALASLNIKFARTAESARLYGASEAIRLAIGAPLPANERDEYERDLEILRSLVEDQQFQTEWAEGFKMATDEAVRYALEGIAST